MDGVININKPGGITSHDVVNVMRRALGIKRIGHTGTLDPMATGVLPICTGKATKIAEMLGAQNKSYRAEFKLGIVTDTQDITGTVISEKEVNVTKDEIKSAVSSFVGKIEQIPPMYSAVKINGKKLYELARKGVEIERPPRKIEIYNITITDIKDNAVSIDVDCKKGTYIRTLCHDIGQALGCGAALSSLIRTKSGDFDIKDSVSLDDFKASCGKGAQDSYITPVDKIFESCKEIHIDEKLEKKLLNGVSLQLNEIKENLLQNESVRIYNSDNVFLCISKVTGDNLKMIKSFY
jgi:tRNA pseudouridine55 synthase